MLTEDVHMTLCSLSFKALSYNGNSCNCFTFCGQAEKGQKKNHKDDKRTGKPAIQGKADSWACLSWRNLREDLITVLLYVKGGYREPRDFLFPRSRMENMRGNVY